MNKINEYNRHMLKWVREYVHMSIEEASIRSELDIDNIENFGIDLSYVQLRNLADLYGKPLALFFFPEPPKLKNTKTDFRTIPSNVYDALSFNIIKMVDTARFYQLNLIEIYRNVNDKKNIFLKVRRDYESGIDLRESIDFQIKRQKRQTPEDNFNTLREIFSNLGIYVFKDSFKDDSVSGFCLYDHNFPVIMINNNNSFTRQIFTLFHEFYHILKRSSGIDFTDDERTLVKNDSNYELELECNEFAANILLPYEEISSLSINDDEWDFYLLTQIANKYSVSRELLARQLYKFNKITLLNRNEYIKLSNYEYKRFKDQNKSSGGNYYNTQMSYMGKNYLQTIFEGYYNNRYSFIQLSKYANMSIEKLNNIANKKGWKAI